MKGLLLAGCFLLAAYISIGYSQNPNQGDNCEHPLYPIYMKFDIGKPTALPLPFVTDFRLEKIGLGSIIDWYRHTSIDPGYRFDNSKAPGYYFGPPKGKAVATDSSDVAFINGLLSEYFSPAYFTGDILNSIQSFYLHNLVRKEFYFDTEIKSVHFRFSGWYDKFMHIYVFTDFNSREGFVAKSNQYFKLPKLSSSKVTYEKSKDTKIRDFIYIYENAKNDFKLFGYPDLDLRPDNEGGMEPYYNYMLLDLTVYPEEK